MEQPLSGCCQAKIVTFITLGDWKNDKCSKCDAKIAYGLLSHWWASQEACAVFADHAGDWWFAWQQVGSWESAHEMIESGRHTFVCQVAEVIGSIGHRHNTDPDLIDVRDHKRFLTDYVKKVKNPEVAEFFQPW